jgi:hypothetical protein
MVLCKIDMNKSLLVILFYICFITFLPAQKYVQIETYGKIKPLRFTEGDEIEFQHSQFPNVWMKRQILRIDADEQMMYLADAVIPLRTIYKVRIDNPSFLRQAIFAFAYSSAVSTFLYSGWAWIFVGVPPNWIAIAIVAAPFTLGYLIKKWTRYKVYNINHRRKIKALDLSFYPEQP